MILSWGRAHRAEQRVVRPRRIERLDIEDIAQQSRNRTCLAHGLGRAYGDSALNDGGTVIVTTALDRVLAADWETGVIRAEAGLSLDDLIRICVPRGWFPSVVPGTKFVTLGGAVAHDVHGKNHHRCGSFGAYVRAIGLARSDGNVTLTADGTPEMFGLTVSGLGLTGIIRWVELQLKPISSTFLDVETIHYNDLEGFFDLSECSADWPYTVAWVDCFAPRGQLGRGIFSRGRFAEDEVLKVHTAPKLRWPIATPGFLLNKLSITAFNQFYRAANRGGKSRQHYGGFFFPLDGIAEWNKLYGRAGFFQHQSLLPPDAARAGTKALLEAIGEAGQGSFLAVMKTYGPERSPGRLCFGGEGTSLALDFANKGESTHRLLNRLDAITQDHNGRVYPAKDSRMTPDFFKSSYPAWTQLEAARDPCLNSSFWRRVTA